MMMSLYSDVINIVAGALLNFAHIYGILLSIGYIILHLVSIGYLLFYRKLGFRYHLKTSRILILFPQIFLLINSIVWIGKRSHYGPYSASYVPGITLICIIMGFAMSLLCVLTVVISEHCVFNRRENVKADGDSKHIEVDVNRELPLQPEPIYDEVEVEGARKPVDAGILTLENMNCQVSLA